MLSAYFQELLETEEKGSECNGVTIDIIKCYNVIPRYPLSLMVYKMGWPRPIIKTYIAALMNLQRSFQILGSVSTWQKSYTGVPEGCALAVAAMFTSAHLCTSFSKIKIHKLNSLPLLTTGLSSSDNRCILNLG